MAKAIAKSMRANRMTRGLIDHRNLVSVTGDIIDVYERPKLLKIIGMILGIKISEIIRPEHMEHFGFFETVCINRGYRVSVFQEKEEALSWLLENARRTISRRLVGAKRKSRSSGLRD